MVFALCYQSAAAQEMGDSEDPGQAKSKLGLKNAFDPWNQKQALKQLDAFVSVPIYQTSDLSLSILGKTQHLNFKDLPINPLTSANDFYDHQIGAKFLYRADDENVWGGQASYGSASDKPFVSNDVSTLSVTMTRKHTLTPYSSWTFFLNYSNNRTFLNNVPLPGAAYTYTDPDKMSGWTAGFPFGLYWIRPTEKTSASFFALFPSALRLSLGYMVKPPFQFNLKLHYNQDVFIQSNRTDHDSRFFYETKKIAAGMKTFLGPGNFVELEVGRTFGRSMFNAKSSFDLSSSRFNLDDEWQALAAFQAAF